MTPSQAIALIDNTPLRQFPHPSRWADLGCGAGLFTLALASLLQPGSTIYAIDLHPSIKHQTTAGNVNIHPLKSDFVNTDLSAIKSSPNATPPGLHDLDGILMANSLHYVKDKPALIQRLSATLQPTHSFLIVEYDTDRPVPTWVPYPLSFANLQMLFHAAGYPTIKKLGEQSSIFGRSNLYAALITR